MANLIFLSILGKSQGLISAGCNTRESIGTKSQTSHVDEILVYGMQHLMTRQQNSNHHPVIVTKPIDRSSPLLSKCISENEQIECNFSIYRINQFGGIELYYKIRLGQAYLTSLKTDFPHSLDSNEFSPQEVLAIKYGDITWNNVACSTSTYSFWDERVY